MVEIDSIIYLINSYGFTNNQERFFRSYSPFNRQNNRMDRHLKHIFTSVYLQSTKPHNIHITQHIDPISQIPKKMSTPFKDTINPQLIRPSNYTDRSIHLQ